MLSLRCMFMLQKMQFSKIILNSWNINFTSLKIRLTNIFFVSMNIYPKPDKICSKRIAQSLSANTMKQMWTKVFVKNMALTIELQMHQRSNFCSIFFKKISKFLCHEVRHFISFPKIRIINYKNNANFYMLKTLTSP